MAIHHPIVADVFTDEAQAKHALEALRQAGFGYDQIGVAMQGHEGIDLLNDLLNLGVPYEHASYYTEEVKAGRIVLSVRPDGREQEAHEIMRRSGAYDILRSNAAYDSYDETAVPQTAIADEQGAASTQAPVVIQAPLSLQNVTNPYEDFHKPRSLKPRVERLDGTKEPVQTEKGDPRTDMVTQQKPLVASVLHVAREHLPLLEEHGETTSIDEEETPRRPVSKEQVSAQTFAEPAHPEKNRNVKRVVNGLLLGGLLLGLAAGVLVAFARGEAIRRLVGERVLRVQHTLSRRR